MPAASNPRLYQVQLGTETTWGTTVDPTVKLMGIQDCKITPEVGIEVTRTMRASFADKVDAHKTHIQGMATIQSYLLYEDICYWLDSFFAQATPSGSDPYTRAYAAALTSTLTSRKLTLTRGLASETYGLAGGVARKIEISCSNRGIATCNVELVGAYSDTDAHAALSDRVVNTVLGHHWAIYMDAFGGTIGSTAIPNSVFDFTLTLENNRSVDHYLGNLIGADYTEGDWNGTLQLNMVLPGNSNVVRTLVTDIVDRTDLSPIQKLIRLKASNTSDRDLVLDFAGTCKAPELTQITDDKVSVSFEFENTYESTFANWFKATSINEVATLA